MEMNNCMKEVSETDRLFELQFYSQLFLVCCNQSTDYLSYISLHMTILYQTFVSRLKPQWFWDYIKLQALSDNPHILPSTETSWPYLHAYHGSRPAVSCQPYVPTTP
jgi:hypothetical protein